MNECVVFLLGPTATEGLTARERFVLFLGAQTSYRLGGCASGETSPRCGSRFTDAEPSRFPSERISVIVPTLNEVQNVDALLAAILSPSNANLDLEILIADGGSTDGTVERVRFHEATSPVRLVEGGGDRGLAGDVLNAAQHAAAIVVVMDGDLSHPAASIPELVAPIIQGDSDIVIGSRYVRGGSTPSWPVPRRLLSRLGAMLAWPICDVRDPMSGFFAVRRDRLLAVDPNAAGFKIGMEIMAAGGDNLRVSEVPITFTDRTYGTSKINLLQMATFVRRLMVLAGGSVSTGSAVRFAAVGLIGLIVDFTCIHDLARLRIEHLSSPRNQFRFGQRLQLRFELAMVIRGSASRAGTVWRAAVPTVPHGLCDGAVSTWRRISDSVGCVGLDSNGGYLARYRIRHRCQLSGERLFRISCSE